jgi:hypothetical protein
MQSGLGSFKSLGMSVDVNVPKPILTAAKSVPAFEGDVNKLDAEMDAGDTMLLTVAVLGVFGLMAVALLWKGTK